MKDWIKELCPEIADWQAELIAEEVGKVVLIAKAEGMEEAAKACEDIDSKQEQAINQLYWNLGTFDCAAAIREKAAKIRSEK